MLTPKQPVINAVLITYIDYSITGKLYRKDGVLLAVHTSKASPTKFCITFNISCGTVTISSRIETLRSSTVRGFRTQTFDLWGSGEVADLHSPDYYPFQKHAFFLGHPVQHVSIVVYTYSKPLDDGLQKCPKHVEVYWRNKLRMNSASSWFSLHGLLLLTLR